MVQLKKVVIDGLYETIHSFITTNEIKVDDYEGMVEVILRMIKGGYCFTMDRDILRDAMECLTYMYAPTDDMNKDRVVQQLCDDDDDDDESDNGSEGDSDEGGFGNMDLLKMMQMMGAPMQRPPTNNEGTNDSKSEDGTCEGGPCEGGPCSGGPCEGGPCEDGECKKVTTDEIVNEETTTVVKEEELLPTESVENVD